MTNKIVCVACGAAICLCALGPLFDHDFDSKRAKDLGRGIALTMIGTGTASAGTLISPVHYVTVPNTTMGKDYTATFITDLKLATLRLTSAVKKS